MIPGFLLESSHRRKIKCKTNTVGWVWPVVSSNQIAGFFDHQYLRKKSSDILFFYHEVSHEVKVASDTAIFR